MKLNTLINALNKCNEAVLILRLEDVNDITSFKVEFVNNATQKANGSVPSEIIGKYVKDVYPGVFEEYPALVEAYRDALNGKSTNLGIIPYEDDNVELGQFNCVINPIEENCIGVFYENVTEKINADKTVKKKINELEAMNALLVDREVLMTNLKKENRELKRLSENAA